MEKNNGEDSVLGSNLKEALSNKEIRKLAVVGLNPTTDGEDTKSSLQEQKKMVCKKMHKAMSPINAISGYLELMKIILEKESDKKSIERYRQKIEEGVSELGEIVEDLYDAFDDTELEGNSSVKNMASKTDRRAS